MIDTKALRNRILDLAIQGKLTEQLPSDGNAEELYQQIQAEKQALINEGKIKKEKPLPEISADEIPFEIPSNWKWLQCVDLCANIPNAFADGPFGSNLKTDHYTQEKQVRIIQLGNIGEEGWRDKNEKYTTFEHLKTIERSEVKAGNIVIAKMMPAGRAIVVPPVSVKFVLSSDCIKFVPHTCLDTRYICYAINSSFFRSSVIQNVNGIGRERTSLTKLKKCIIPVPPLAEQKRIVERVEEIFRLLDTIDEAQEKYSADTEILKAKLITAAIQGKLTQQLPSDGTAEELYQQIQAEKQKLISEGKIKKEKPLPPIADEEIPFEIPSNWKWCRFGEICSAVTGKLDANQQDPNGEYPFFTCGQEVYRINEYAFDCDAILLGGNNASGDYKMHRYKGKFNAYQRVYVITIPPHDTLNYLYYIIGYWLPHLKFNSQGAMTRFIRIGQVYGMLVPLPPLAEQKRIAETLEKVLGALG